MPPRNYQGKPKQPKKDVSKSKQKVKAPVKQTDPEVAQQKANDADAEAARVEESIKALSVLATRRLFERGVVSEELVTH